MMQPTLDAQETTSTDNTQKPDKKQVVKSLKSKVERIEKGEHLAHTGTEHLDAKISQIEQRMRPIARTKQGYGYTYATLTELLSHVIPAFKEFSLSWTSWSNIQQIGEQILSVFTVQVTDLESGQHRESVHVYPLQTDAQKVGSYETYYRRYSLISLLGLPIKDDDGQATRRTQANRYQRGNQQ